jgi:hypothetical protein
VSGKDNLDVNSHPYWSQITVYNPIQNAPDPCTGASTTYTKPSTPNGTFYPVLENDLSWGEDDSIVYITIVNGSPYDFKLNTSKTHEYQMSTFNFYDVPAGEHFHCASVL